MGYKLCLKNIFNIIMLEMLHETVNFNKEQKLTCGKLNELFSFSQIDNKI